MSKVTLGNTIYKFSSVEMYKVSLNLEFLNFETSGKRSDGKMEHPGVQMITILIITSAPSL